MQLKMNFLLAYRKSYLKKSCSFFFAIFILFPSTQLIAQNNLCDRQLMPLPDNMGYKFRKDRCEGLYRRPISEHGGLELVSLTKGRLKYELEPGKNILLKVASDELEASTIRVRAIAKALRTYYRMDTLLSQGKSWRWPIDEVLLPLKLTNNHIGIFAWVEMSSGKIFLPVQVDNSSSESIYLIVRPKVIVHNVQWRLSNITTDKKISSSWQKVVDRALAGEPIKIYLPKVDHRLLLFEVGAVLESGGLEKLRMKVWNE